MLHYHDGIFIVTITRLTFITQIILIVIISHFSDEQDLYIFYSCIQQAEYSPQGGIYDYIYIQGI